MENLDFFDKDGLFNDHITNHNKRLDLYLISGVSKLVFDGEFYHHIKSELKSSVTKLRFKRYFLFRIEHFIWKGHNSSRHYETNFTTVRKKNRYNSWVWY